MKFKKYKPVLFPAIIALAYSAMLTHYLIHSFKKYGTSFYLEKDALVMGIITVTIFIPICIYTFIEIRRIQSS